MATTYKILGQTLGTAGSGTWTNPYTVPSATSAIVSTITVCNQTSTPQTYSIGLKDNPTSTMFIAPSGKEYVVFQASIPAYTTTSYTLGITLSQFDQVAVSSSSTNMSFNLFGTEIS